MTPAPVERHPRRLRRLYLRLRSICTCIFKKVTLARTGKQNGIRSGHSSPEHTDSGRLQAQYKISPASASIPPNQITTNTALSDPRAAHNLALPSHEIQTPYPPKTRPTGFNRPLAAVRVPSSIEALPSFTATSISTEPSDACVAPAPSTSHVSIEMHVPSCERRLIPADFPLNLLYSYIFAYVGRDDNGRISRGGVRELASCALVCLEWANHCRVHLFRGEKATIRRLADLTLLDTKGTESRTRLSPLMPMLGKLELKLDWESILLSPAVLIGGLYPEFKEEVSGRLDLIFSGPVPDFPCTDGICFPPDAFCTPPGASCTPPWILQLVSASHLPFTHVSLNTMHFPCLSALNALLSHLSSAQTTVINLTDITWYDTWYDTWYYPCLATTLQPGCDGVAWSTSLSVHATGCTNNSVACQLAFSRIIPSCASVFHYMNETELAACESIFNEIGRNSPVSMQQGEGLSCDELRSIDNGTAVGWNQTFPVSIETTDYCLELQCESDATPGQILTSVRLVGFQLWTTLDLTTVTRGSFIKHLHSKRIAFPHLRRIELRSRNMDYLRVSVYSDHFPGVLRPIATQDRNPSSSLVTRREKPLTLADLPPELHPYIVAYVGRENNGNGDLWNWMDADLASCSLVCLDWANRCRERRFRGADVTLRRWSDILWLDKYEARGCARLTPLFPIVGTITMDVSWESSVSSSLFPAYAISHELRQALVGKCLLRLYGPIPPQSSRAQRRSLPWNYCLPRTMPQSLLPFTAVALENLHFSHLSDLDAFLGNLTSAERTELDEVTWDHSDTSAPLCPRSHSGMRQVANMSVSSRGCTEDRLACKLAFGRLNPSRRSVFKHMDDTQLVACESLLSAVLDGRGRCRLRQVKWSPDFDTRPRLIEKVLWDSDAPPLVSREIVTFGVFRWESSLELQCEADLGPEEIPVSMRVVGLRLWLSDDMITSSSLSALIRIFHSNLAAFPHLRVVELHVVGSAGHELLELLRRTIQEFPDICQLPTLGDQVVYRWACDRRCFKDLPSSLEEHLIVEVDPATLLPSGNGWGKWPYDHDQVW